MQEKDTLSRDKIVCACGCGSILQRYDDRGRERKFVHGHNKASWKGGRYIDKVGYVHIYKPGHPRAQYNGYVYEHILVMEKHLGRHLNFEVEEVHHINGNKQDNRIENLKLVSGAEHRRIHNLLPDIENRICSICGGNTYIQKRNSRPDWRILDGQFICSRCWNKRYREQHREQHKEYMRLYHIRNPKR